MTVEEVKRIEAKMKRGEKLEPSEWCEGFSVVDGKVTDRSFHGENPDASWNDEDEEIFKVLREELEYDRKQGKRLPYIDTK